MKRQDIIRIGTDYLTSNIENNEWSYPRALKTVDKNIKDYQREDDKVHHEFLDIRFESDKLVILVETKDDFSKWDSNEIRQQLQDYATYKKEYTGKNWVALLVEADGTEQVHTWYEKDQFFIDEQHRKKDEKRILTFDEYENLCLSTVNNKAKVVDSIKH